MNRWTPPYDRALLGVERAAYDPCKSEPGTSEPYNEETNRWYNLGFDRGYAFAKTELETLRDEVKRLRGLAAPVWPETRELVAGDG